MRVLGLALAGLLGLTLGAAPARAASQIADHLQSIAEAAYVAGDYERAYRYFELAFVEDSSRTDNLHRQALCAEQLGQFPKAEALLRQALLRPDARPDAHFDLAVALYMQRQYREALEQLELARQLGVQTATLDYYQGVCEFRLGQYKEAYEPLSRAYGTLPQQPGWLGYYLGGTELALDNYQEAISYLEQAYQSTPPGEFRDHIGRLLTQARDKQAHSRWWSLALRLGGAHDSNIFYEPDDFGTPSDRNGWYGYADADAALYPLRREAGSIGFGYHFYQSVYFEKSSDEKFSNYNLTTHAPRVETSLRLASGKVPVYLSADYEYTRAILGGEHYQDAHVVTPGLTIAEQHWTATRLGTRLESNRFPDFNQRDAFYAAPSLAQLFTFFAKGDGRLYVEASYEHNDAEADTYSYRGVGGYVATNLPIYGPLSLLAGTRYRYLDYLSEVEQRIDRKIVVDAALRVQATKWFDTTLGYRFQNNTSLENFSYEKHLFYGEVGVSF